MPCQCNCSAAQTSAAEDIAAASSGTLSVTPTGVCRNSPCSTQQNLDNIAEGFAPADGTDCSPLYPVLTSEQLLEQRRYRSCTDENGCTALYPGECRDGFWPDFAHPRWLCCKDLYNAN